MNKISENVGKAKKQIKETFRVTTTRPVAILMIVIGVFVFGIQSLDKLPLNLMPEISYPSLTVRTEYEGAAPEEVENTVSKRIESQLALVDDLVNISSISKSGISDVVLEFKWNADMNKATADVREKLDQVFLPTEVKRPLILRYDPSLDPIIRIAFYSTKNENNLPEEEIATTLRDYAENELREKLESLEGVAAVRVRGGLERELLIELDANALRAKNIDPGAVINRVSAGNINVAGGNLREGETEYQVRVLNEYKDLDTIRNLIIDRRNGIETRLSELARVKWHHKEREIFTRVDGEPSVEIQIFKEADANIVSVAKSVRDRIFGTPQELQMAEAYRKAQANLDKEVKDKPEAEEKPEQEQPQRGRGRGRGRGGMAQAPTYLAFTVESRDWGFDVLTDQSIFIKDSIDEVRDNAVIGGILSIVILFLFLKSPKSTVIIGLTIPISIVATFAPMNIFGVSLNIMSLGGLALGIGMLVDNAIVVLESIFRCKEEGDSLIDAVVRGTGEVGGAVIASTLTTIAVFFPIVFVEGVAGQIFGDMSLVVVFSLLASMMAALFFIPMLASRKVNVDSSENAISIKKPFNSIKNLVERFQGFWRKQRKLLGKLLMIITVIPFHLYLGVVFILHFVFELVGKLALILTWLMIKGIRYLGLGFGFVMKWVLFPVFWIFNLIIDSINNAYPVALRWALKNKIIILVLITGLTIHAAMMIGDLKAELIPEIHQGEFNVRLKAPVGTDIEQTNRLTAQVESAIIDVLTHEGVKEFETMATVVGAEKSSNTRSDEGENTAVVTIRLKDMQNFAGAEESAVSAVREKLKDIPGLTSVTFDRPVLFSFKTPIEVEIKGQDRDFLKAYSNEAVKAMESITGVTDVKNSIQPGNPELQIIFDRDKLRLHNLDIAQVAQKIRNLVEGNISTEYRKADRQYDIRVRLQRTDISNKRDLENLRVSAPGTKIVRLVDVASVMMKEGPNEIRRIDQERTALISANVKDIDLKTATERIREELTDLRTSSWRSDYRFDITGQTEEMKTSSDSLTWAMALAVFLVYIVMASQFESLIQPFIIIFTIPLAMIGVVYLLTFTNTPVSIVVLIGAIMLAGIVVNNAIVLVDYINQLRQRGMEKVEAIINAGKARLRPILMTTMTTVLGLLPMALGMGAGAEIRTPMAWTVIAGLLSSTLLTLIVIPTVYEIVDRRKMESDTKESEAN